MSIELYNEEEVLQGCQQENRRYQEILYRRFAPKMYGICLSYAGDRALAQDMLQEGFIKVFRSIKDFRGDGSLEGWIRRIVVRTAIDLLRQRQSLEKLEHDDFPTATHTDNEALPNLQLGEVLHHINSLPDGARVVFNLFAVEGYTHREIAEQLNISEGTSKSQYNRARSLLKDWLGKVD
ncbi:RNA polymerase sigma factor [Perlabentimonas gracilis]|uniref:RNA polymerase sigma factor n=1 Tax=Perlabentimonas gracilis TaxID=2715279 RepID=UPI00140B9AF6|nr:sigma-70 family RNA polymerase sigma factor [Perlabentimonas gracilis]NHB67894.1 sigma-70 family RNA polymerase sigma factor [Perlabentimonas gracilis]